MNYNLETLGDERFQQLCQAILVCEHPNVQCLPVGQPDGGRDALLKPHRGSKNNQSLIFQVKFVRNPSTREARDSIEQVIKTEKPKIDRLVQGGASSYYLLTNVPGTSHPDVGSIDKLNATLSSALKIDAYCWWRDDIERRIDVYANIKWSYPDILRATDLLQALLEGTLGPDQKRRTDALRSYMVHQAKYDSQLKFKQIDLQKNIIDLFVDVPAHIVASLEPGVRFRWASKRSISKLTYRVEPISGYLETGVFDPDNETATGALELLTNSDFASAVPKVVVEGAPGQGKSTVTQYLCQLHRLLLLNRQAELGRVEEKHRPREARIPFRIDIRDYASWIAGRNPFSSDPGSRLPAGTNPLLESFISAQVNRYTGVEFSVSDLKSVIRASHVLIVLDGFDEVADIVARDRIVSEVSDAAARIAEETLSTQIIITSRPAAFANSPGFPRDEWQHVQILALSSAAIESYADKWLDGRNADAREKRTVINVLRDKLKQPHVRDLARNPMQLAILLALISVQGASLPDKRTALYDKYIDIFLDREADKSNIVRDHRDLLIQIHRYLAWLLQADSEIESGAGHINEAALRDTVREFLRREGHPTDLVDQLFSGMVERVVALVSRVQGTFEFEVQPLREYFAARYLYDTAPYSPYGAQRRGSLPERFDALSRNFYWLNVTRFYSGCYSSGELASLLIGIDDLNASEQFKFISHGAQLALTLVSDYVFSHQPKLASKVLERITQEPRFRILLGNRYVQGSDNIILPVEAARGSLTDRCKELLAAEVPSDTLGSVARVLSANSTTKEVMQFWSDLPRGSPRAARYWVRVGAALGVFEHISVTQCESVELAQKSVTWELIRLGRFDILQAQPVRWKAILEDILNGANSSPIARPRGPKTQWTQHGILMSVVAMLFSDVYWTSLVDGKDTSTLSQALARILPGGFPDERLTVALADLDQELEIIPKNFIAVVDDFLSTRIDVLKTSLAHWSVFIEAARSIWGDRWAIYRLSLIAATVVKNATAEELRLIDKSMPLCDRMVRARRALRGVHRSSSDLASVEGEDALSRQFVLYALLAWMPLKNILQLSKQLSEAVDALPDSYWHRLAATLGGRHRSQRFGWLGSRSSRESKEIELSSSPPAMSVRLASILLSKVSNSSAEQLYKLYLTAYSGADSSVLIAILDFVVGRASEDPAAWVTALPAIAHAYSQNIAYPRHYAAHRQLRRRETSQIPPLEARQICEHASEFPLELVGLAESVLASKTGSEAMPVGKVATRDGWFLLE